MMKSRILSMLLAGGAVATLTAGGLAVGALTAPEYPGIPQDLVFSATGVPSDAVVMTVDGEPVLAQDLFARMISTADQYAQMGLTDWAMDLGGTTLGDLVLEASAETAIFHHVVLNQASQEGCTMTDADQETLDSQIASIKGSLGAPTSDVAEALFAYQLAYMGQTPDIFMDLNQLSFTLEALETAYYGPEGTMTLTDEEATQWVSDNGVVRAKHILISAQPSADGTLDMATALAQAEALRAELSAQGDSASAFETLMMAHSHDINASTGQVNNPEGYTYDASGIVLGTQSGLVPQFVQAGAALEIGAISEPVQSDYGYHILMRMEPNTPDLTEAIINSTMNALSLEWMDDAVVETTPEYDILYSMDSYTNFNPIRTEIINSMTEALPPPTPQG